MRKIVFLKYKILYFFINEREENEKENFWGLQRIGRSFMLPSAVLPIAGMFLGIGSSLTNEATIASLGLEGILGTGTTLNHILILLCL